MRVFAPMCFPEKTWKVSNIWREIQTFLYFNSEYRAHIETKYVLAKITIQVHEKNITGKNTGLHSIIFF